MIEDIISKYTKGVAAACARLVDAGHGYSLQVREMPDGSMKIMVIPVFKEITA